MIPLSVYPVKNATFCTSVVMLSRAFDDSSGRYSSVGASRPKKVVMLSRAFDDSSLYHYVQSIHIWSEQS